jgi:hypothetical protein
MTGPFDELLERLTHRLRVDPELQMEVTHELRTHLEDAAAEFAGGGMSPADAQAAAIKAMGEEAEIADKLWQANRRRLRVRRAVKWTVGLTLIPVAGGAAVAICWSGILVWLAMSSIAGNGAESAILEHARSGVMASLSPQARLVVESVQSLPFGDAMVEHARKLTESSPSDPIYWANYAIEASECIPFTTASKEDDSIKTDVPLLHKALDVVESARKVEPDNAFYPLLECSDLQDAFTRQVHESDEDQPGFDYMPPDGTKPQRWTLERFAVTDPAGFAQSMADFHTASTMSFMDSHAIDLMDRRVEVLPAPESLYDWVFRVEIEISTPLFWLNPFRQTINVAGWVAYDDAVHHREAEALATIGDARRLSLLSAQKARTVVELLVASGCYSETLAVEAIVDKQLGKTKEFEQAKGRYEQWLGYQQAFRYSSDPLWGEARANWSSIDRTLIPSATDLSLVNTAPSRQAEYAVADRLAVAAIMIGLIVMAGLLSLDALVTRLLGRKPIVVPFIGVRRLARVLAISTIVPLAVYALYAYATPLGGRQYGALFSWERITVEYTAVGAACVILARTLTDRALRSRLAEMGSDSAPPLTGRMGRAIGVVLAVAVVGFVIVWWLTNKGAFHVTGGFVLVPIIDLYWLYWLWPTPIDEPARQTRQRAVTVAGLGLSVLLFVSAAVLIFNGSKAPLVESTEIAVGVALLWVCGRQWMSRIKEKKVAASGVVISQSLPLALSLISMACVMAVVAGIPLSFVERQAVQRIDAPGGDYSIRKELDYSRLRALQQRMTDMLAESPAAAVPAS